MIVGETEIKLDSGKIIKLDLRKITIKEFRLATDKDSKEDESDAIVAKACGLTLKALQAMAFPDYRRVIAAWWRAGTQPLDAQAVLVLTEAQTKEFGVEYGQLVEITRAADSPNSPSESTSA
jgi:hypothetical protein